MQSESNRDRRGSPSPWGVSNPKGATILQRELRFEASSRDLATAQPLGARRRGAVQTSISWLGKEGARCGANSMTRSSFWPFRDRGLSSDAPISAGSTTNSGCARQHSKPRDPAPTTPRSGTIGPSVDVHTNTAFCKKKSDKCYQTEGGNGLA